MRQKPKTVSGLGRSGVYSRFGQLDGVIQCLCKTIKPRFRSRASMRTGVQNDIGNRQHMAALQLFGNLPRFENT